jgi:hypothetical protein
MYLKERLTKMILESRNIQVNKKDVMGNDINVEEIKVNELYKISDQLTIKFVKIDIDIYDLYIIVDNQEEPRRTGTIYRMDDNNWIAQSNVTPDLNKEGLSLLDSAISLLSVEGIV